MNIPRKPPSVSPPVQVQQQPRGPQHYPRGTTPPITYRHQLGQEELSQIRSVFSPQQVVQFSSGYAQGAAPHDMNKQPVPAHVSAAAGPSPQTGMQTQVMYQTNPQQPPPPRQTTPSFVQPRQSIPQSIRPQRQPMNMASSPSPGQPMYNTTPMQTTMFVPGQPPPFIPGQPQVIIQQGPPPPMQVPPGTYSPQPRMQSQFAITTSQPGTYSMTPSPQPYYQPPSQNSTVYFTQAPAPGNYQMQQPQRPISTPQHPYTSKREKKILRITDPNTGKDINEEIMQTTGGSKSSTPPLSGPSSLRATPVGNTPPPQPTVASNPDIAAQFAAQVAATLSTNMSKNQQMVAQFVPAQPIPAAVPSSGQAPAQVQATVQAPAEVEDPTPTQDSTEMVEVEIKMDEVPSMDLALNVQVIAPSEDSSLISEPEVVLVPTVDVMADTVDPVLPPKDIIPVCESSGEPVDLQGPVAVESNPEPEPVAAAESVHESIVELVVDIEPQALDAGIEPVTLAGMQNLPVHAEVQKLDESTEKIEHPEAEEDVTQTSVNSLVVLPEDRKAQKEDFNREEKVMETQRVGVSRVDNDPLEEKRDPGKENEKPDPVAASIPPAVPKDDAESIRQIKISTDTLSTAAMTSNGTLGPVLSLSRKVGLRNCCRSLDHTSSL